MGKLLGYSPITPVSVLLNNLFSKLLRRDFQLIRNYTVTYAIDNPYAKWPKALGSAVFLDSKYLF